MARVLVAEADEEVRALVALLLDLQGHDVVEVADGRAALTAYAAAPADVVVADVVLPAVDGLDLTRALRAPDGPAAGRALGIVLLTGPADGPEPAQGASAGADVCVTKPFDVEEFIDVVARLLARVGVASV